MVSLIVPCYNSESYIERCIESILNQTYKEVELIIINDGSNDATEEKLDKFKRKIEEKFVRYIYKYQKNGGVGAACNTAFKSVTGDYLMLLDSDDTLCTKSIQKCVEFLEQHPDYDLVRTNGYYVTEDNLNANNCLLEVNSEMKIKKNIFDDIFYGRTYVWPGSYMIRMNKLD